MLFDPYTYDLTTSVGQTPLPDPLLEAPADAQATLWHGLLKAVEGEVDLWERLPAGHHCAPVFPVQHAGKLHFPPESLRAQTLAGWHRLVGIELRLAAQALEALLQAGEPAVYQAMLAEQCARIGQLYAELKRRAGAWVALALLRWELRLLRYRASPVASLLIYD